MKTIRLGTRSSRLALWQAHWVRNELVKNGVAVEIFPITTTGDKTQSGPIEKLGAQGVFTKEIQKALLRNEIDLAVHSLKDLPTESIDGLTLAAVPRRENCQDVFVSSKYSNLAELPNEANLGTGSLRRQTQIRYIMREHFGKSINVHDIRGNIETRLQKLETEHFDAIILAAAGLKRLDFENRITSYLPVSLVMPAVGQGALGLETRLDDFQTIDSLKSIEDQPSHLAVLAERSFLLTLQGGCIAPIAALATLVCDSSNAWQLKLQGRILSLDSSKMFETLLSTPIHFSESTSAEFPSIELKRTAEILGNNVAQKLLDLGASDIVREINQKRLKSANGTSNLN
ncbi:MAG: hydroxymethylbilane synthase [Planctomycetia bacterium]|nr:hydroxymethylbilane synthase [Planctomycetia bacterium]